MVGFDHIVAIMALLTYCGFLISAMVGDIKSFTISNRLNIAFFISFIIFALLMGFSFSQLLQHFWIALIAFLICFALFAF
ncbi:MAG: prepilin peptidase, partial [Caulobacterales bacterium]|nr:prepilin peptidase [Caulobacterales bacterium]